MNPADFNDDPFLDAQLRDVPLPPGLAERIGEGVWNDAEIDRFLQKVETPRDLVDRLQIAAVTDAELDFAMRDVPTPDDLTAKLQATALDADDLDNLVCDVSVPGNLERRLRLNPFAGGIRFALASSAAVALIAAGIFGLQHIHSTGAVSTASTTALKRSSEERTLVLRDPIDESGLLFLAENQSTKKTASEAPSVESPLPREMAWRGDVTLASSGVEEIRDLFESPDEDPLEEVTQTSWGVFGADPRYDEMSDLQAASALSSKGAEWPALSASQRQFLLRYGVHPFVSPSADQRLETNVVPLNATNESFRLTQRYVRDGELPPPDAVRTEDFLAAMNYPFAHPTNDTFRLSASAGPAPFERNGISEVLIGAQAGDLPNADRPATHAVFLLDASSSMNGRERWTTAIDGLRLAFLGLKSEDRVSLIVFNERTQTFLEAETKENALRKLQSLESMTPKGATNLGAALAKAYAMAQRERAKRVVPTRVILVTDGLIEADQEAVARLKERLHKCVAENVCLDVVELRAHDEEEGGVMKDLAASGNGRCVSAGDASQFNQAVSERLSGRSTTVAEDVTMKVVFHPHAVASYRLVGHEAKTVPGFATDRSETTFRAGQAAAALYEVELRPGAVDPVMTVELSWSSPDKSLRRSQVRIVKRQDFAETFQESAPELQLASLAARTAEILRNSPFVDLSPRSRALQEVFETAASVDWNFYKNPSYDELVRLVDEARSLHVLPSASKKSP